LLSTRTEPLRVEDYWSLDLNADFSNENWSLRGYVKNVTDERGYQSIGDITDALTKQVNKLVAAPIQPRTIGIEVDYRF
jgi:outer membrane receptor protein involved in Fe transport